MGNVDIEENKVVFPYGNPPTRVDRIYVTVDTCDLALFIGKYSLFLRNMLRWLYIDGSYMDCILELLTLYVFY